MTMPGVVIPTSPDFLYGARDLTALSPVGLRRRMRERDEVTSMVWHQTSFERRADNPRWALVAAHAVVLRAGEVLLLHPLASRLRRAANAANPHCVSIEIEGNLPSDRGRWFSPEKFGRTLAPTPEQVESALALGRYLAREFPIKYVHAHRQWSASRGNCPGPQIWASVCEPLKRELGLTEGPTGRGWASPVGTPIPDSWRTATITTENT